MGIFEDKDNWIHDEYPDICFRWFANHRTLKDFMTTKKKYKVVVAGGYDTSDIKGYGMLSNPVLSFISNMDYSTCGKLSKLRRSSSAGSWCSRHSGSPTRAAACWSAATLISVNLILCIRKCDFRVLHQLHVGVE